MSNEALSQLPHKLATLIKCLPQAPFSEHLAAECIKQAERIAELEAAQAGIMQAITDTENQPSQYGTVTLDYLSDKLKQWECLWAKRDEQANKAEAERDQLRAEVERLRADADRWHVANLTAETAWKHPDHRSQEENTAFSAYRCAVEDGLNFEGAVDAAVAAIAARTTHKDEG